MAKKNKSKTTVNPKVPKEIEDQKVYWEDLLPLRKEALDFLISQQALLQEISTNHKEIIEEDNELKQSLVGIFKSFTDIAKVIRTNMDYHLQLDDDNNLKEQRSGEVTDEEFPDYLHIASNYQFALEQLTAISASGFQELLTRINSKTNEVDQKDIDNIGENYVKEVIKLNKDVKEQMDGK